ncbi:MAG: hypothetical protein AAB680_02220 [Pseudomonadota bacterium]
MQGNAVPKSTAMHTRHALVTPHAFRAHQCCHPALDAGSRAAKANLQYLKPYQTISSCLLIPPPKYYHLLSFSCTEFFRGKTWQKLILGHYAPRIKGVDRELAALNGTNYNSPESYSESHLQIVQEIE